MLRRTRRPARGDDFRADGRKASPSCGQRSFACSAARGAQQESGFLTNVRQHQLVQDSIAALDAALPQCPLKTPHEMILLDLYNALRPLDEITGATTATTS